MKYYYVLHNRLDQMDTKKLSLISLSILFIVNFFWFHGLGFQTLMGDDIYVWDYYAHVHSFFDATLLNANGNKYRPVLNLVQYILNKSFGNDYNAYFLINILFNFTIIYLLHKVLLLLTNNRLLAFGISLMYLTSRFSYYNIIQLNGILEALCLFFLLSLIYCAIKLYRSQKFVYGIYVVLFFLLIVFTHERYIALLPFLLLLFWLSPGIPKRLRFYFMIASVIPFLINLFLKMVMFQTNLLEGTGGTTIDFNIGRMIMFFLLGIINLFGVNLGPPYLNGAQYLEATSSVKALSLIICFLNFVLFVYFTFKMIRVAREKGIKEYNALFLSLVSIISLVLVASITIRVELRWLYAPFIIFMLLIATIFSELITRKKSYVILFGILVLFSVINDTYYRNHLSNTFFMRAQHISDSTYEQTIKKFGTNFSNYLVYIEKHQELGWPLANKLFFKQYIGNKTDNIQYVEKFSDISSSEMNKPNFLAFRYNPFQNSLENVTTKVVQLVEKQMYSKYKKSYDFIENFKVGQLQPKGVKVDTPTGEGALVLPWDNGLEKNAGLTILTGFTYSYPGISIKPNAKLIFTLLYPYPIGDGARVTMKVENQNQAKVIFAQEISSSEDPVMQQYFEVDLEQWANTNCTFSFNVDSPSGNAMADWIVMQDLKIIEKKE